MKQRKKYFIIHKQEDFLKGRMEGLAIAAGTLRLAEGADQGTYRSCVFDSGEAQTVWNRMQVMGNFGIGTRAVLSVYAADTRIVTAGEAFPAGDVEALLKDASVSPETLDRLFAPCLQAEFSSPEDVLLHRVRGRYLWFRLELEGRPGRRPAVQGIKIGFPKDTWLKYLPELYQEDADSASFLERYLGIFQSMYEDLSDRIGEMPLHLNPRTAELEYLEWLAEWLAVENRELWNESQLRYLVSNAASLYRIRGTVRYLKELFRLYTGREPFVTEEDPEHGPGGVTVLLDTSGVRDSMGNTRSRAIRKLAEMTVPAGASCRIVELRPGILLGQNTYLGINSVLGGRQSARLDGVNAIPFTVRAGN